MKQSVIDQMKEYQCKRKIVKAIQYQEGMEDAWMTEYEEYRDDCEGAIMHSYDKLFDSKEEAEKYGECINAIPVVLKEISKEVYDSFFAVTKDGKYYEYKELSEDSWIIIDDEGNIDIEYGTDSFDATYELPSPYGLPNIRAEIGFDKDLLELFVDLNHKRILLDKSEVVTVEKILEILEIPYTEKLGELLLWGK